VMRCSGLANDLVENMRRAVEFKGFAVLDIWGICTGRYSRKNRLSPREIKTQLHGIPAYTGIVTGNERPEYVASYYQTAGSLMPASLPLQIEQIHTAPQRQKQEILLLGSAGQRIVTAGELLCLAAMSGGMQVTQKNDYDITVLKGPSVSEIILWPEEVGFTGIENPDIILVFSADGVKRRQQLFSHMSDKGLVLCVEGIEIPQCKAQKIFIDLKEKGIGPESYGLAALALLARKEKAITIEMLNSALKKRFIGDHRDAAQKILEKILA